MNLLTKLKRAEYLGSHPRLTGRTTKVTVEFYDVGIRLAVGSDSLADIAWSEIIALEADDREHLESRVTASRVLLVGLFALAIPKTKMGAYLVIEVADGAYVLFIPGLTSVELHAGLGPLQPFVPDRGPELSPPESASRPEDIGARLTRLDALHAQGLVSSEEYSQKRRQILDEI